ncbi:MAG: hypothetical protein RR618_01235 [Cellulosilyticaceae bacterium]
MSDKKRWIICGLLACILIGTGLFQAITGIELSREVMYYVELGVMIGVLYFLVIYPKSRQRNQAMEDKEAEDKEIQEEDIYEEDEEVEEN